MDYSEAMTKAREILADTEPGMPVPWKHPLSQMVQASSGLRSIIEHLVARIDLLEGRNT